MDNFWINGKPIALLFGEKWSFWDPFSIEFKIGECLNWTIFGINGKPIALLFGEKWSFWDPFSIDQNWRMFYSLTFW